MSRDRCENEEWENFLARPGEGLCDHLTDVEDNAIAISPPRETPYGGKYSEINSTIARLHDIGKMTSWFQSYVNNRDEPTDFRDKLRYHAKVSAYFTYEALRSQGFSRGVALAGFYAVRYHHGDLPNLKDAYSLHARCRTQTQNSLRHIPKQIHNIEDNSPELTDEWLRETTDGNLSLRDISFEGVEDLINLLPEGGYRPPQNPDKFYPFVLQLASTLNCADKLAAAGVPIDSDDPLPDYGKISFENKASGIIRELNDLRTEARKSSSESLIEKTESGKSVFKLTLPTGFGKTFAGLEGALKLAEEKGGRVVYALPYTTVIDQVHEEVLNRLEVEPDSNKYTIHHHLADTRTSIEDEEVSDGTEALYGESWQAGLVLTTFVQLFESLASPTNLQSIKLPSLQNSVIVIDEPQAIPHRWWHLISQLTTILVEEYDATVVLMTATQPQFIDEFNVEIDPIEIAPSDRCFGFLEENERVRFRIDSSVIEGDSEGEPLSTPEAAGRLIDIDEKTEKGENILAVNNSVRSAAALSDEISSKAIQNGSEVVRLGSYLQDFYRVNTDRILSSIQGRGDDISKIASEFLSFVASESNIEDSVCVMGLSAALRPCDRSILVEAARRIVNPEKKTEFDGTTFFVSATQLVEAGVDISFNRVYRDFAPVPSLVQAAGRCNRSFEGDMGTVVVWQLEYDDYIPSKIYADTNSRDLLIPSRSSIRQTLSGEDIAGGEIPESVMITDVVQGYYDELHSADDTSDENDELVQDMYEGNAENLREESLVDSKNEDCLVLTSDEDERRLNEYLEKQEGEYEYEDAKEAFDELKYLFASIPPEELEDLPEADGYDIDEFDVVDSRGSDLYSIESGLGLRKK
ncbi:MAG: CRISPR-associated endonuclease Cas3'' [Halobacteria archaeon]|nr:CRISPR-associated endonuclease Cas3'' [Halobacteria archaeon]